MRHPIARPARTGFGRVWAPNGRPRGSELLNSVLLTHLGRGRGGMEDSRVGILVGREIREHLDRAELVTVGVKKRAKSSSRAAEASVKRKPVQSDWASRSSRYTPLSGAISQSVRRELPGQPRAASAWRYGCPKLRIDARGDSHGKTSFPEPTRRRRDVCRPPKNVLLLNATYRRSHAPLLAVLPGEGSTELRRKRHTIFQEKHRTPQRCRSRTSASAPGTLSSQFSASARQLANFNVAGTIA